MNLYSSKSKMAFGATAGLLTVGVPLYGVNGIETVFSNILLVVSGSLIGGFVGLISGYKFRIIAEQIEAWKEIKDEINDKYD